MIITKQNIRAKIKGIILIQVFGSFLEVSEPLDYHINIDVPLHTLIEKNNFSKWRMDLKIILNIAIQDEKL